MSIAMNPLWAITPVIGLVAIAAMFWARVKLRQEGEWIRDTAKGFDKISTLVSSTRSEVLICLDRLRAMSSSTPQR